MATKELDHSQACQAIRKAARSGKKQIEINGVKYNLRTTTRQIVFTVGPVSYGKTAVSRETKRRVETNIIAKRADGALVPTFNVKYDDSWQRS